MKILYFLYFILTSDYKNVINSLACLKQRYNVITLLVDNLKSSFIYGTSLDDYFNFRFYEKSKIERSQFATTLFMYQFHRALNIKSSIAKIDNKIQFKKNFGHLAAPSYVFNARDKSDTHKLIDWLRLEKLRKIVVKDPEGTTGTGVHFLDFDSDTNEFSVKGKTFTANDLFKHYAIANELYVEPYLKQHPSLQTMAPSALNTIRIITVLSADRQVEVISAALRISILENIDNFSNGNLAAAIDLNNGKIISPGIQRRAACSLSYKTHPVTKKEILGFQVPFWEEVLTLVKRAALVIPEIRTVGWDVAVLEEKVVIIEGNPKWNKGVPQIPLDQGIKEVLLKYL